MTASATLVLANHRPETIPLARRLMAVHDTILLEEPPDKRFEPMLDGNVSIDAYLEDQELEYPEFSRRMAQVLRERRQSGTRLVQVEPFIDLLLSNHDAVKGILLGAQLRHLLAAERSAVVPKKNQHQWALPPEVAQQCPRMIPQLNLSFTDCTHIQIYGCVLSALIGRSFPKLHEGTEIVRRHNADELPLPGHRQQVASTFAQLGNNRV